MCWERARAHKDGRPVELSRTEFRLLATLARRLNEPVRAAEILADVWNGDERVHLDSLRSFVRLLRRKLEDDPSAPRYLLTYHGRGYSLVDARSR